MKRLLTSTTALSLVLSPLGANPAFAQIVTENGSVIAVDGTLLCDASGGAVCDASLYVEQAAAIEARVRQEEEAAAEQKRLEEEAAALAEQKRLDDEAAALAEQKRLDDEAAALAEQKRLDDEIKADEAEIAEQQRQQDEAIAASQQKPDDEALAKASANVPANMILTDDGSLLAENNSLLCDVVVSGTCDPALYVEPADAISRQMQAEREAAANATLNPDASQTDTMTSVATDGADIETLRETLESEKAFLLKMEAQGNTDAARQSQRNVAFLEQEILVRENAAIQPDSAEDFAGRKEALKLLADYRRALDQVTIDIAQEEVNNPGNVERLRQYKAKIETDIEEINHFLATGGGTKLPSDNVPPMPETTQSLADAGTAGQTKDEALLAKIEAELTLAKEAQDQGKIDALEERKAIIEAKLAASTPEATTANLADDPRSVEELRAEYAKAETGLLIATQQEDADQVLWREQQMADLQARIDAKIAAGNGATPVAESDDFPMRRDAESIRETYVASLLQAETQLEAERAKDPNSAETRRLEEVQTYLNSKITEVDQFIATKGTSGLTPFDESVGRLPVATADGSGGTAPAEILPPNLIRTGDGSLLAEDNTILCDTTVVEVCNAADYVAKANEITAFLDSQSDKGMDAEVTLPTTPVVDPSAGLVSTQPVDPSTLTPVAPIQPKSTEAIALSDILVTPTVGDVLTPTAAAGTALAGGGLLPQGSADAPVAPLPLTEIPSSKDATVVIETMTDANTRNSSQEFAAAPVTLADGRRTGLTAFETVGLVALGALIVGAVINEGRKDERRVVSNTGDRVVVLKPDGTYQVYKDDDTVLRRPGSTVRTETFNDGSTRTIVQRVDGSQIVTIRDASGRVLRRAQYDKFGRERLLIDDFQPEEPVIITDLPRPKKDRIVISSKDEDAALKARMAALEAKKAKRGFSLRQIREIPEVRDLAAQIDVESITFDSGSAAIKAAEAENLADLGQLMQELLEANPGEMFLIEGHTDATGHPAMNLALSDRRAESVALALAEYFDIPPENLVVQGYGESELLIDTQKDERANRRVLVRVITPLLKRAGG